VRLRPSAFLVMLLSPSLFAQAGPVRKVHGATLISNADPAASFVLGTAFRYAGGQTIDILKVAGAEQYFFMMPRPTIRSTASTGSSSSTIIRTTRIPTTTRASNKRPCVSGGSHSWAMSG
jgi:hypothetical protein